MSVRHALLWDRLVQPAIASVTGRADRAWSWTALRSVLPLAQQLRGNRCTGYCILVQGAGGRAIPAAMVLVIETYPHVDVRLPDAQATFAWFLATAPDEVLGGLGVPISPSLGRTCIDIALTTSFNLAHQGRIGLHAAQAGGSALIQFYDKHCRLLQLSASAALPVRRANDGRFFYTDDVRAGQLAVTYQQWR